MTELYYAEAQKRAGNRTHSQRALERNLPGEEQRLDGKTPSLSDDHQGGKGSVP